MAGYVVLCVSGEKEKKVRRKVEKLYGKRECFT